MPGTLSPILALSIAASSLTPSAGVYWAHAAEPAAGDGSASADEDPRALFRKGKRAFDVGEYSDAVELFQRAYDISDNELLLYNIGLSYFRWWEQSKDINHLRKARSIFRTFVARAQREPERLGDPTEAVAQLNEIEAKLEVAEKEEVERKRREAETNKSDEGKPVGPVKPQGPDPGKNLRLGGTISMGVGGALMIGGVIAGVIFALKSRDFKENLVRIRNEKDSLGLVNDPECSMVGTNSPKAEQDWCSLAAQESTTLNNGRAANLYTVLSFSIMGGLGVAALATGGGLFAYGVKKTRAWEEGRILRFHPTFSPTYAGLGVSGRF